MVVALAADDSHWPAVAARLGSAKLQTTLGGVNRQDTVLNGLDYLAGQAAADDWVLVHDAARPCFNSTDLTALLDAVDTAVARAGHGAVNRRARCWRRLSSIPSSANWAAR